MTRIPDAFDDLIAQHPEGDPDAILTHARRAAEADRARRRTILGLATAAAIVVVVAMAAFAVTRSDEPGDQIHAGPDPTTATTVSPTPADTTVTTTPAATTTTPPATPSGAGYAIASSEGVSLRTGTDPSTDVRISDDPAAAAFAIGTDLVVYQGAAPDDDRTPPWPDGGVQLWTREKSVSLPLDERTTRAVLLDAGTVDESPMALVALHRGTNPDTAHEALVMIDLRTLQSETIVDNPSWESSHVQARLLPDGDVIGLITSEASWSLARWTAGSAEPAWTTPVAQDTTQSLAILGYRAALAEVRHDPGSVTTRSIDLDTGALGAPTTVNASLPDTTVWCGDWYRFDELSCARGGWPAGGLGSDGSWRELSTPDGAIVTASRD